MKVLEVHDKNDLREQICYGESVSYKMDKFFRKLPSEYGVNYYRNLETLEILKTDEESDKTTSGTYDSENNIIFYNENNALAHEILHMASYDSIKKRDSYSKNTTSFEYAFTEGMTEYLKSKIYTKGKVESYFFPVFAVTMLENIHGLVKNYFIPNYKEFISLFPNRKDIFSLMYSLEYFNTVDYSMSEGKITSLEREKLKRSIYDSLESIIDIELSLNLDKYQYRLFREKFMDLLDESTYLGYLLKDIDRKYYVKAYKLIKDKRI